MKNILQGRGMELLLRLSSALPRQIIPEFFFQIHPPTPEELLKVCVEGKSLLLEHWLSLGLLDASFMNNLPIIEAAHNGHLKDVSLLLAHGADPSARGNTPVRLAMHYGHPEVVSLLIDHGAEPSYEMLRNAAKYGHAGVVSVILRKDLWIDRTAPFCEAIKYGHLDVVTTFLEHGTRIPAYALYLAVQNGHCSIVSLLLAHGANAWIPIDPLIHDYLIKQ